MDKGLGLMGYVRAQGHEEKPWIVDKRNQMRGKRKTPAALQAEAGSLNLGQRG